MPIVTAVPAGRSFTSFHHNHNRLGLKAFEKAGDSRAMTRPTTMPHAGQAPILVCPDILMEIFNHLQPGRRTTQEKKAAREHLSVCRRALLASALACRELSDFALDVLWRALDDVQPLFRLLPGHKRHHPMFVLKPEIPLETWMKFQRYAARVRKIGYSPSPHKVHPSVWTFLAIKCGESPLLPHLYDLDARDLHLSPDDLSPLCLLLAPSLRSLSLTFGTKASSDAAAPEVVVFALRHITQVAPRVQSFYMLGFHAVAAAERLSILQELSGMTELSLGSNFFFDGAMFRELSTMTSLRAVTIALNRIKSSDLQPLSGSLQVLRTLTLRGDLEDIIKFAMACRLPLLDAFTLQVDGSNDPKKFGPLFASLCQQPGIPAKSLTRIRCEFLSGMIVQRQETLLQYLEPLLSFPKVEHCNLIFHNTAPSVCDEDLIRLGDAWPNLQYLNLAELTTDNERYGRFSKYGHLWCNTPDIQHPTVLGLTELARRCPTLQYIHLVTADVSALPQVDAVSRLNHPMREIHFDYVHHAASSGEKRCAVAEVLDLAFPKLNISLCAGHRLLLGRPETRHQWRRILMLVRIMRHRRKHPASDSGDAATQNLADLNVDRAVTDSEPELDPDNDEAMDSDSSGSQDLGAESDSSESDADDSD